VNIQDHLRHMDEMFSERVMFDEEAAAYRRALAMPVAIVEVRACPVRSAGPLDDDTDEDGDEEEE
jgi:hypothetical protein